MISYCVVLKSLTLVYNVVQTDVTSSIITKITKIKFYNHLSGRKTEDYFNEDFWLINTRKHHHVTKKFTSGGVF